jgi:hypothetical protein
MRNPKLQIVASLFTFGLITVPVAPFTTASAQSAVVPEDEKEANDMRKLAARARETEPFFAATEPFEVSITTNIRGDRQRSRIRTPPARKSRCPCASGPAASGD